MSQTAPTGITASPATPDRADRSTFSSRATAWADWLKNQAVPEISAVEQNVYDNAVDAFNSAVSSLGHANNALGHANDAAASAIAAAASANAAGVTAGALPWVYGNTYGQDDSAISQIDFQTYRKITPSSVSLLDPAADNLGDWVQLGATENIGAILHLAANYSVL